MNKTQHKNASQIYKIKLLLRIGNIQALMSATYLSSCLC